MDRSGSGLDAGIHVGWRANRVTLSMVTLVLVAAGCSETQFGPARFEPDDGAVDAREVLADIEAAKATVPLLCGAVWRSIEVDKSGAYGASSGRSMIEFQAACAWFRRSSSPCVWRSSGDRRFGSRPSGPCRPG